MPQHPPSQHAPPNQPSQRPGVSTAPSHGLFWLVALLLLPALNVGLLGFVASAASVLFLPLAALIALGDLVLLMVLARSYGIGVPEALLAMLVNAGFTVLIPIVVFAAACGGCLS